MVRRILLALLIYILFTGCGSNQQTNTDKTETIFGTYKHKASGKAFIELYKDSTARLDTGAALVNQTGKFSFRNDSIFIEWGSGKQVKSRFVKKKRFYFFYIGATRYQREV
ncbi:MAG: hypothetical protein ABIR30_04135 [Chitinophagaceae bacterium]